MKNNIPTYSEITIALDDYTNEPDSTFINGLKSSDEYVVWSAVKGCGLKKINSVIPILIKKLGQPCKPLGNTDVRRISAWSLSKFDFNILEPYLKNYDSNNLLLLEGFADMLGLLKDIRGLYYLDKFLNTMDDNIYLWASLALSKIGEDSLSVIQKYLNKEDISIEKKIYLLDALKKINTTLSNDILEKYLDTIDDIRILNFLRSN